MKIAVLGTGNVGGTLGRRWAQHGRTVVFGTRDLQSEKVRALLAEAGENAAAASAVDAVAQGDVVVLAAPWAAAKELLESIGDWKGKVLVDCINPLNAEFSGLDLGYDTSAAERIAGWARDFGYSKSADEALAVWGHDEVLRDVVRVIREVRPDVVVTRFGPTDDTHGHHVASALLAEEAFALAGDPTYVVDGLAPWQPDRLVRNQSSWRIDATTDTSGWLSLDVGGYDPLTGRSWGEVAADSRTMHKSQGFGSAPSVGRTNLSTSNSCDSGSISMLPPLRNTNLSMRSAWTPQSTTSHTSVAPVSSRNWSNTAPSICWSVWRL